MVAPQKIEQNQLALSWVKVKDKDTKRNSKYPLFTSSASKDQQKKESEQDRHKSLFAASWNSTNASAPQVKHLARIYFREMGSSLSYLLPINHNNKSRLMKKLGRVFLYRICLGLFRAKTLY